MLGLLKKKKTSHHDPPNPKANSAMASDNFTQTLVKNMGIAMFFLMPITALITFGVFRSRRKFFSEHLIFSVHAHSITLIILSIAFGIDMALNLHSASTLQAIDFALILCWAYVGVAAHYVFGNRVMPSIGRYLTASLLYALTFLLVMVVMAMASFWFWA